jgi:hypothetical protein
MGVLSMPPKVPHPSRWSDMRLCVLGYFQSCDVIVSPFCCHLLLISALDKMWSPSIRLYDKIQEQLNFQHSKWLVGNDNDSKIIVGHTLTPLMPLGPPRTISEGFETLSTPSGWKRPDLEPIAAPLPPYSLNNRGRTFEALGAYGRRKRGRYLHNIRRKLKGLVRFV